MAVLSNQVKLMCENCEWETIHKMRLLEGAQSGCEEYVWACIFCGGESEHESGPDTELMMVPLATVGGDWSDPDELEVIWREGINLR